MAFDVAQLSTHMFGQVQGKRRTANGNDERRFVSVAKQVEFASKDNANFTLHAHNQGVGSVARVTN